MCKTKLCKDFARSKAWVVLDLALVFCRHVGTTSRFLQLHDYLVAGLWNLKALLQKAFCSCIGAGLA